MFFRFLGAQHSQFYTLRNNFCHLGLAKPIKLKHNKDLRTVWQLRV